MSPSHDEVSSIHGLSSFNTHIALQNAFREAPMSVTSLLSRYLSKLVICQVPRVVLANGYLIKNNSTEQFINVLFPVNSF
jgi:hypothetical protein